MANWNVSTSLSKHTYDFQWDNDRCGFVTLVDGEEVDFFKANSKFDRSAAQDQAKKLAITLRNKELHALRQEQEHKYQYEKPLSQLELEWVALQKRFMQLNDKELDRWQSLNQVVRKSLHDGTHQALK